MYLLDDSCWFIIKTASPKGQFYLTFNTDFSRSLLCDFRWWLVPVRSSKVVRIVCLLCGVWHLSEASYAYNLFMVTDTGLLVYRILPFIITSTTGAYVTYIPTTRATSMILITIYRRFTLPAKIYIVFINWWILNSC